MGLNGCGKIDLEAIMLLTTTWALPSILKFKLQDILFIMSINAFDIRFFIAMLQVLNHNG